MHKEYILLNGFRKAKRGFTAGFRVPLNQLFFIKATKAAGQDRLSKFEAVECSKIKATGSGAASTAIAAPLFL